MKIDFDNKEWQLIEIPEDTRLLGGGTVGSFNQAKIKLLCPDEVIAASGRVKRETNKLPTAKGYHNLDGREVTVFKKNRAIFLLRVEDCGLGSAKADQIIQVLGFKFL